MPRYGSAASGTQGFSSRGRGCRSGAIRCPLLQQRFGPDLGGIHDAVAAFPSFAPAVGMEREADTFGSPALAREAEMAPPFAIVIPDMVVGSVVPIGHCDEFVFHSERGDHSIIPHKWKFHDINKLLHIRL